MSKTPKRALLAPVLLGILALAPSSSTGIDVEGIDRSIRPGDDFYGYANGAWMKATEIPPDRSAVGAFSIVDEEVTKRTAALIQEAGKSNQPADSDSGKVGAFYGAFMNEKAIEDRGFAPMKAELAEIAAIGDRVALARVLGSQLRADVDALNSTNFHTDRLFGLWAAPGFESPDRYVGYLLQGGLGMLDRDDYTNTDPKSVALQGKYRDHVAAVLRLAQVPDADARAAGIYALEKKIAETHVSRTDSVDVHKANNPWKLADFAAKAPGLDWSAYFAAAGLSGQPMLIVWHPSATVGIAALVGKEPLDAWKDYLTFHAVDRASTLLPRAFADERFAFYGTVLTGAKQPRDRWKRAVAAANVALGDAVGRLYVERYFPPSAKAQAQEMVQNIRAAFVRRIDKLEWMSPATREKAKAKVGTLYVGMGYPEHWKDYGGLTIDGDALANERRSRLFEYRRSVARLGKPVDKSEWCMTPQTVNAVNLPLQNALNFPAAILNPPFFDPSATAAQNYGGVGTVIGHEISHSFDDQGSQFDADGRLANWWTPEDFAHFQAAAERLAAQYDAYEPLPGLHVNGKLTLSENIADVAGISAAFDGYRAASAGKATSPQAGFGGDQQFFLSFAQIWRRKQRPELTRGLVMTDGHAPGEFRADTVRNVDAWYPAFDVKEGEKLYLAPGARVRVW
ncbi:MAG TPA: M13 family metallopeptidase [Thermoanaerobaculia bacterium]